MKFCDISRPLHLDTDASCVGLGVGLLQIREGMNCGHDDVPDNVTLHPILPANRSLLGAEWQYSNIKWEAFGILPGLEKFYCYCFGKDVCVIMDHKPLVMIINKDLAHYPGGYIALSCAFTYIVCAFYTAGWQYSKIKREAFGILPDLEKFYHYCFGKEVCKIMDHKPLVMMINKGVATLSQWLHCIKLGIRQYSVCILYKSG